MIALHLSKLKLKILQKIRKAYVCLKKKILLLVDHYENYAFPTEKKILISLSNEISISV